MIREHAAGNPPFELNLSSFPAQQLPCPFPPLHPQQPCPTAGAWSPKSLAGTLSTGMVCLARYGTDLNATLASPVLAAHVSTLAATQFVSRRDSCPVYSVDSVEITGRLQRRKITVVEDWLW